MDTPEGLPKGSMRAANLHGVGLLQYEEVEIPACGADEVLVKVKNCGICGSDIGRVLKHGTYHFPTIPGHEFSGQVVYDPEGAWQGRRVAVYPLLPCFRCESCRAGRYAQCADYDYYGSRRDGAFAEYVAVKRFNLLELPENVSYEEGAMCEPASVALHAVKRLSVAPGEHILILGAGPIGLIAGMWARSRGAARVEYVDIDPRKIEFCQALGFSAYDGKTPADAALEGTGASSALANAVRSVKPTGRIVLMGNPSADVSLPAGTYQMILRKELRLNGIWNSMYAQHENDWKESLAAISQGKLPVKALITHRIPMEQILPSLEMMSSRREFCCKVMIDNEK